ncbi:MAG: flagellar basal body-associated protein FliL [Verrucomicrobiia bacterium]
MPTNRLAPTNDNDTENEGVATPAPTAVASRNRGISKWLPLVLNIALMPVLAYATTTFLLLPKFKLNHQDSATEAASQATGHSPVREPTLEGEKAKFVVPLGGKVLVNIAGTMGTRYLLASLTLVSARSDLKNLIEKNDAQLRDAAAGVLACKTIADLEKPDARNLIRTELISTFNHVLGSDVVRELYLTEFAIQ